VFNSWQLYVKAKHCYPGKLNHDSFASLITWAFGTNLPCLRAWHPPAPEATAEERPKGATRQQ